MIFSAFNSLKNNKKPLYSTIVCIYTCKKHHGLLREFHASMIGEYLRGLADVRILEVYADDEIPQSTHQGNVLLLSTVEEYEALSLKTQMMMDYCVQHFDFKRLVKIDVTTVMTQFDSPEYDGRQAIDLVELLIFLRDSLFEIDYDGFMLHAGASRENAENWAAKKGKLINFRKLFSENSMPPFFSGKCYIVSQRFAQYIGNQGRSMAKEHIKYFLGAEDLMVGRLFEMFKVQISH